jgi:hypothetical protein
MLSRSLKLTSRITTVAGRSAVAPKFAFSAAAAAETATPAERARLQAKVDAINKASHEEQEKTGVFGKVKKYGLPGVAIYSGLYAANLALFYVGVKATGASDSVLTALKSTDVAIVQDFVKMTVEQCPDWATDGIVSVICTDLMEPIRLPLTFYLTKRFIEYKRLRDLAAAEAVPPIYAQMGNPNIPANPAEKAKQF